MGVNPAAYHDVVQLSMNIVIFSVPQESEKLIVTLAYKELTDAQGHQKCNHRPQTRCVGHQVGTRLVNTSRT